MPKRQSTTSRPRRRATQSTLRKERSNESGSLPIAKVFLYELIRFYANDHQWNAKTESREDHEGTVADKKTETPKEPAIFRRYMDADSDKKVASEEVEILSPDLWTLLEQVDGRWSDLVRNSANSIVVQTPFYHFVWSWDSLMSACEPKENDSAGQQQARKDLKELLDTLKGSDWLRSWARSLDSMKTSKKIKFEYLWTIFSHGRTVYARSYLNDMQMFKVISSSSPPYKGKRFRVTCGGLDWNGSQFAPYWYDFFIKEFDDERSITELTVFPTDFYGEGTIALRERLLERGRSYCKICRGEPVTFQYGYQGTAIVSISQLPRLKGGRAGESGGDVDEDDETPVVPVEISGSQSRVIVDNYWFLKSDQNTSTWGETPPLGPKLSGEVLDCPCGMCKDSPLKRQALEVGLLHKPDEVVKAFEDQGNGGLLLLPPRMLGFALREKVWGQFSVDKIKTLSYDAREEKSDPFWSELQLKDEYKELLMAFVDGHVSPRSRRAELDASEKDTRASDVIDGKGQGVAILLHGPPGVGKTLTAETVALATRRPLLTVSVAEIGTKSTEAEARLEGVFADAARWEAVLLMDEADVFVEQRKKGDLERNALVSVLLRCLEYFDGIIILTTNRVRSIDMAVQSRINLAIQYKDLNQHERLEIYKQRLRSIPEGDLEGGRAEFEKELAKSQISRESHQVNGRQIRNIVNGARALAKRRNTALTIVHLETVANSTTHFINSMKQQMQAQRIKDELGYGDD